MPLLLAVFFMLCLNGHADEKEAQKEMILRQAQEYENTTVAVEAYLAGDVMEANIYVRMYASRPKIYHAYLYGPKLGRLSPRSRETLYPQAEDEDLTFPTTDLVGTIRFSKRTQDKKATGALTRELVKFKIPVNKILPKKRYELRVQVESMQSPGMPQNFSFKLQDFAQSLEGQN